MGACGGVRPGPIDDDRPHPARDTRGIGSVRLTTTMLFLAESQRRSMAAAAAPCFTALVC
jgi:hypothetical protein